MSRPFCVFVVFYAHPSNTAGEGTRRSKRRHKPSRRCRKASAPQGAASSMVKAQDKPAGNPDEAAREIWRQPEEQNVKQSPLIHSFPNVSQNTLPASSAFRPFKSAHQGGIETDSGCAAGALARSLIGLRRRRSSAAMPALEMLPRPKPEEACAPEPYERATYPRQWISANAKRCIADSELRLFQYTADDIFARLRFLTYAVCLCLCRFPKKRSGGMRGGEFERRLSRPTTASRLPTAFSMASVNPMLLSRQHAMCGFAARGVRTHRAATAGRKAVAARGENASVFCSRHIFC